jgi:DNA-binding transcriptional LysR family regulator
MPREYQFPFELRHLVYFREVARQLHFRKAAEALAVAQPALSRQIAQMEHALGVKLFLRTQRRVELTAAGRTLLARIEPILRALQSVTIDCRQLSSGESGHLRIAFSGLAMATVLPGILREFSQRHPGIRLELNESPTSAQLAALHDGELDCGFFHPDSAVPGIETHVLLRERNGVLLPPGHPLAKRQQLRLRDLATLPFVLFPRAHNPGFYDRILAAWAQARITPRIAEEVWPRANGIGLVRAGLGATFITPSEAKQLPPDVQFRPLIGRAPESRLVVGWKNRAEDQPALNAFLRVAREHPAPRTP